MPIDLAWSSGSDVLEIISGLGFLKRSSVALFSIWDGLCVHSVSLHFPNVSLLVLSGLQVIWSSLSILSPGALMTLIRFQISDSITKYLA